MPVKVIVPEKLAIIINTAPLWMGAKTPRLLYVIVPEKSAIIIINSA
jgi:hypothetical protein